MNFIAKYFERMRVEREASRRRRSEQGEQDKQAAVSALKRFGQSIAVCDLTLVEWVNSPKDICIEQYVQTFIVHKQTGRIYAVTVTPSGAVKISDP